MKTYKSEKGRRLAHESYDRLVAAWGIAVEERDLDTSYGSTHVILAGSTANPLLLMFHGAGDNSAMMWIYNAPELSRHFRLVAVDTIGGSGKSVPDERYHHGFDLRLWLGDLLVALDVETCCAIGVSYGCYLAQLLTAVYPDVVRRFVGIGGYIVAEGHTGSRLALILF